MSSRSTERGGRVLALAALLVVAVAGCGPSPEALLRSGRADQVLLRVRPVNAAALRLRAAALRQQGKLAAARVELQIALGLDERSAAGHRLMGLIEAELGAAGGALAHLQRSVELQPRQPEVRAALAELLLRRSLLRVDPALHLDQLEGARDDLKRVGELNPRRAVEAAGLLEALRAPSSRLHDAVCPGAPPALAAAGLPRAGRCRLPARRLVEENGRRYLLAACNGAALALHLEGQGCLAEARRLWEILAAEAPGDPRWPLQLGRLLLAEGRVAAAELRFTDYLYLARDCSGAQLRVAELLLAAGRPRQAGARAVQALALAGRLDQQLVAVAVLRRCGLEEAVRQAVAAVLSRGWGLSHSELRARLAGAR